MELVIHGTKGGYKILYSTPNIPLSVARDVRPDTSSENAIGQSAYSLSFIDKGRVYTKYRIVRDMLRGMYTGNIAISIYLTHLEVLPGSEIVNLLNNLLDYYRINYAKGDNLDDLREDWSFVDKILKDYKSKTDFNREYENIKSGLNDACYIYYENEYQLQKYFDNPYQDEYNEFKQVIFINNNLKNANENPLFAIRNSGIDLTDKIDLENPKYKLIFNANATGNLKISVKVNGNYRNGSCNIKRKDNLEISWSKPYHINKNISGKCFEISEYLLINDDKTVNIKEIELESEIKSISLQIVDGNGMPVNDAEISCKANYMPDKLFSGNMISFIGEEIKERWTITASKGENLRSDPLNIIPDNINRIIPIILKESVTVIFLGNINNEIDFLKGYNIEVNGKYIHNNEGKAEFYDNEIEKELYVEVSKKEGNFYYFGKKSFIPKKDKQVNITIEKNYAKTSNQNRYKLDAGKHGILQWNAPEFSSYVSGEDLDKNVIIPNKGYVFTGWKLEESKGNSNVYRVIVAQYKKTGFFSKPIFIILISAFIIFSCLGFWFFNYSDNNDKQDSNQLYTYISNYSKGKELNIDTLNNYKNELKNREPDVDSKEHNEWENTNDYLDSAISLRVSINELNFNELKKMNYSQNQKEFYESVMKINDSIYDNIEFINLKNNIANMTLNDIADKINDIVARINDASQVNESEKSEAGIEEKKEESKIEKTKPNKINQPNNSVKSNFTSNKINEEIKKFLNGNDLNLFKIESYNNNYNEDINDEIKNSIKLCIKFWDLVEKKNKNHDDYYNLQLKILKDKPIKESKVGKFLISICKKIKDKKYDPPQINKKYTLEQLEQELNKIK